MDLWTLLMLVILTEALLHYFPWRMLLRGKKLHRLAAYTLGLLGMMVPFTAWLWQTGEFEVIKSLWLVILAAGMVVSALYGVDDYLDRIMREIEKEEQDQHGTQG
jgi:4-hydroxybenzoate polyprenyltransferase